MSVMIRRNWHDAAEPTDAPKIAGYHALGAL